MPPVPVTAVMIPWSAIGVVAQTRSAICDRITWHNVVRELHFLLGGAPRPDFHCSLMSLRESQIDRESEKHSFYGKILVLRKRA